MQRLSGRTRGRKAKKAFLLVREHGCSALSFLPVHCAVSTLATQAERKPEDRVPGLPSAPSMLKTTTEIRVQTIPGCGVLQKRAEFDQTADMTAQRRAVLGQGTRETEV